MKRKYYAFTYADGYSTTYANVPTRICGEIHQFNSMQERDSFVKEMNYTQKNNLKPCNAILRQHIAEMGHSDYFTKG
jgi:hypothetical protein